MMGASEIAYGGHSRSNGCACPLHGYQFIAWGCFLYFAVFYFMTTVPHILEDLQPVAYVILAIFLIVHLIVHLLASCINPADPNVLKKMRKGHHNVGSFNRSEHRHVIENQHCYLCEVDVGVKSKHCSTCNKCVAEFDHHCKWLNNCVGGRNYRLFIATLCTAISGTLVIFITCLVQFVAYYTDTNNGDILKPYHDIFIGTMSDGARFRAGLLPTTESDVSDPEFRLFYVTVPDLAWQIMTMFTTVLAALATGLMGHLLGFHIYLMCKNLSTYDYIIREREKSEQRAREQMIEEQSPDTTRSKNKPNKVLPKDGEMQTKHQTRSTWAVLGGIDEYAIVETAQLSGETPPPVHTPPFSRTNHSHHGNIPTLSQQVSHEQGHAHKKKRRTKQLPSSANYQTSLSHMLPLSPGNSIQSPINGHLPALDDSQELVERIRKSQEDEMTEDAPSDGIFPSSSVQQVDFSMRRKQKMPSRSEVVFNSAGHLSMYSPRGFNADSNVYRTLPRISAHSGTNSRNKTPCNMGSSESLQEIPIACTQHGRRNGHKQHGAGYHSYGPEIGAPVQRRPKRNHHKNTSKHGIVNSGARLNDDSSTSDDDQQKVDGVVMTPHGVHYGNKVTHTVEIYSDRTPRPPRHKDVPPLDLSALHHDSDVDQTKRTAKSNKYQQASQI